MVGTLARDRPIAAKLLMVNENPQSGAERARSYRDRRKQKALEGSLAITGRAFWEREPDEEIQQIFNEIQGPPRIGRVHSVDAARQTEAPSTEKD